MSAISTFESDLLAVAKKVKDGIEAAGTDAEKVLSFIAQNQSTVSALASLAGGQGTNVSSVGIKLIGSAATAIAAAGDAASANGVSVSLDAALVAAVKTLVATVKSL